MRKKKKKETREGAKGKISCKCPFLVQLRLLGQKAVAHVEPAGCLTVAQNSVCTLKTTTNSFWTTEEKVAGAPVAG